MKLNMQVISKSEMSKKYVWSCKWKKIPGHLPRDLYYFIFRFHLGKQSRYAMTLRHLWDSRTAIRLSYMVGTIAHISRTTPLAADGTSIIWKIPPDDGQLGIGRNASPEVSRELIGTVGDRRHVYIDRTLITEHAFKRFARDSAGLWRTFIPRQY